MANALYPKSKARYMQAGLNLLSLDVRAYLVNLTGGGTTYTYDAAHEFLDDIAADALIAVSGPLSAKTINDLAWFDSDDPTITAVTGVQVEGLILAADTGTTAFLLMYQDTGITNIPLTPDGSDVQIVVDSDGWFQL